MKESDDNSGTDLKTNIIDIKDDILQKGDSSEDCVVASILERVSQKKKLTHKHNFHRRCLENNLVPREFHLHLKTDLDLVKDILRETSERIFAVQMEEDRARIDALEAEIKELLSKLTPEAGKQKYLNDKYHGFYSSLDVHLSGVYEKKAKEYIPKVEEKPKVANVINLSKKNITPEQLKLLSKGLMFSTPIRDYQEETTYQLETYLKGKEKDLKDEIIKKVMKILKRNKISIERAIETHLEPLKELIRFKDLAVLFSSDDERNIIILDYVDYKNKMLDNINIYDSPPPHLKLRKKKLMWYVNLKILDEDLKLSVSHMPKLYGLAKRDGCEWTLETKVDISDTIISSLFYRSMEVLYDQVYDDFYVADKEEFRKKISNLTIGCSDEMAYIRVSLDNFPLNQILDELKTFVRANSIHNISLKKMLNVFKSSLLYRFEDSYYKSDFEITKEDLPDGLADLVTANLERAMTLENVTHFRNGSGMFLLGKKSSIEDTCSQFTNLCRDKMFKFHIQKSGVQVYFLDGVVQINPNIRIIHKMNLVEDQFKYRPYTRKETLILPHYGPRNKNIQDCLNEYDIKVRFVPGPSIREHLKMALSRISFKEYAGIYRFPCECGCVYVGRTLRSIEERVNEHRRSLKKNNDQALMTHVNARSCPKGKRKGKIKLNEVELVAKETFSIKRVFIRESIEIFRAPNHMNINKGVKLNEWWRIYYQGMSLED